MAIAELTTTRLEELLGEQAQDLLSHRCQTSASGDDPVVLSSRG